LIAEELPAEVQVIAIPWWEGRDSKLPTGNSIGSDQAGADRIDIGAEIEIARSSLTEFDCARMAELSVAAAKALGEAMKRVEPSDREVDIAGRISAALWSADLEIAFLGVAGERRARLFRHPLPTIDPIGARVVASICAKRKGLIASVTRIISFQPLSDQDEQDYLGLLNVEAVMLSATLIGAQFSAPVLGASTSYGENGFELDEWHRHHQGGPTGYLPRDWPATPTSQRLIAANQPVAWNPTGKGWKVEDTWLTEPDGLKLLSIDPTWPAIAVAGRVRPAVLLR
jgi:antitoxin VapB